jgi:hypothetical protein
MLAIDWTVKIVPAAVQTDDQAVAEQLVFPDPLDAGHVLDPDLPRLHPGGQEEEGDPRSQDGPRPSSHRPGS